MHADCGDTITFFFKGEMHTTKVLEHRVCIEVYEDKIELVESYFKADEETRAKMYDQMELDYICEDVPECPSLRVSTANGPCLIVNEMKVFQINGKPCEMEKSN